MAAAYVEGPPPEYWVAQGEFHVRIVAERLDAAAQRWEAAHARRLIAEAPEWVDGRHSLEAVEAARDDERAAEIEVGKLTDKRDRMLADLRPELPGLSAPAPARPAAMRARCAPRPRERRCGGARRSSSSSSSDDPADSDDPEPALGGRTARAPRSAP